MVGRIMDWLLDGESSNAAPDGDVVVLTHKAIASLNAAQAQSLSLPETTSLVLELSTNGLITERSFRVSASWRNMAGQPMPSSRVGAILEVGTVCNRIPEPLFSIIGEVERYNALQAPRDRERYAALAQLQEMLPTAATEQLRVGGAMQIIRVVHAVAFSLSLEQKADGIHFDPVLFGRGVAGRSVDGNEEMVSEDESLLPNAKQEVFAGRFRQWEEARNAYPVSNGFYVYVDAALKPALNVVRKTQDADKDTRWAFARNPQAALRQALSDDVNGDNIEYLFVETEQYSQRVVEIGVWEPPVLAWIQREPNAWLPERFGIRIGDRYVSIEPQQLDELVESVKAAIRNKLRTVQYQGESITASPETLQALKRLVGLMEKPETQSEPQEDPTILARQQTVLVVDQNFETVNFVPAPAEGRESVRDIEISTRSTLKHHQREGLKWLQETWKQGYPGALLADDMGLGKTLQALVFLRWIQLVSHKKWPILIVAPTGLLPNWESEHDRHLEGPGLGECLRAYGPELRKIKTKGETDLRRGTAGLKRRKFAEADWILISYETLRDYQLSIAPVRFACVVFDEIQKTKNPASLISHAARTLNADFSLGLTGTPLENRIEDLWSIMDILSPGLLGDLKSFSAKYRNGHEEPERIRRLRNLRSQLLESQIGRPPAILRRMKANHLEGLPPKHDHPRPNNMPDAQTDAYAQTLLAFNSNSGGRKLELIHRLRGISLHPYEPKSGHANDTDAYVRESARTAELFRILDKVQKRNEKALVFLESLDMQDLLAVIIQRRYQLTHKPLQINGGIPAPRRQEFVEEFQKKCGVFDVMILSPRAGGVGLTLTAANHVIHLSRWWNPAVEDQCTDRTYRIGQEREVHVYYPMAKHPQIGDASFDCILDRLLQRKRKLSQRLLVPPVDTKADMAWMEEQIAGSNANEPKGAAAEWSLNDIDRMEPLEFERWVIECLRERGYQSFQTQMTGDGGADGVFRHPGNEGVVIVQCKHTGNPERRAPSKTASDLLRARATYNLPDTTLVGLTNASKFSRSAKRVADDHGILLIARANLIGWPRNCSL